MNRQPRALTAENRAPYGATLMFLVRRAKSLLSEDGENVLQFEGCETRAGHLSLISHLRDD
jgi:hypothetical protein